MGEKDLADAVQSGLQRVANSITANVPGSRDETGEYVESLTEAVMGMTAALVQIANAISYLGEQVGNVVDGRKP
jgi:hypothetical protein